MLACQSGVWKKQGSSGSLVTDDADITKYYGRETIGTYRPAGFNGPMNCRTQATSMGSAIAQCWVFKVSAVGRLTVDAYVNTGVIFPMDWCTLDTGGYCGKGGWEFLVSPLGIYYRTSGDYVLIQGAWRH